MLATVSNAWWPQGTEKMSPSQKLAPSAKNQVRTKKNVLRQNNLGRLPECRKNNQEVTIRLAGPCQNSIKSTLLLSVDLFSDELRQNCSENQQR